MRFTQERFLGETGHVMFTGFPDLADALKAVITTFGLFDHMEDRGRTLALTWFGETPDSVPALVLEVQLMGERWLVVEPMVGGFKTLVFDEQDLV